MARGGARSRSGPAADLNSGRSDARGLKDSAIRLNPNGFSGRPPAWPLHGAPSPIEQDFWKQVWKYPQAAMWKKQPWKHMLVAQYVRWSLSASEPGANASAMTQALRLADAIGLTPAGLRDNGWVIGDGGEDEKAATVQKVSRPERRLRAVED